MGVLAAPEALYVLNVCVYQVLGTPAGVRGRCCGPLKHFGYKMAFLSQPARHQSYVHSRDVGVPYLVVVVTCDEGSNLYDNCCSQSQVLCALAAPPPAGARGSPGRRRPIGSAPPMCRPLRGATAAAINDQQSHPAIFHLNSPHGVR